MSEQVWISLLGFPLAAYLCGSVPFAVLIARAHGVDLRKHGSGNVGATNVARVLGRRLGYLCFALDVAKGFLPVLLCGLYLHGKLAFLPGEPARTQAFDAILSPAQQAAWLLTAFGAIAGHVWSLFLRFRGGKGVATSLGVVLGFYPYYTFAGLAAFAAWIAAALIWRYVSLASVIAAALFPPMFIVACRLEGWPLGRLWPLLAFSLAICAMVIVRHRSNLRRLLAGTESKIGSGKNDLNHRGHKEHEENKTAGE